MPARRLEIGFCAAARIARPSDVKRKKRYSATSTARVTPIVPISCGERYGFFRPVQVNGLGKLLIVYEYTQPATMLRITSSAMNTNRRGVLIVAQIRSSRRRSLGTWLATFSPARMRRR